jgi:cytoskeletal protein CcmA (bactofilin family)
MKTRLLFLMLFLGLIISAQAQVSINQEGNDPHESAMLDVSSSEKGLLIPRMTSEERDAIINPANGLMVFNNTTNSFWFYSEATGSWEEMGGAIVSVLNDLLDAKTDANSIYVGYTSGQSNDGNNFNTSIGSKSMRENTAGSHNIALGYRSLTNNTTGNDNVALGENSLAGTITGNKNTVIGKNAGAAIGEDASGNIFLGFEAGKTENGNNKLYIENSDSPTPLIGGDFDTDEVKINGTLAITGGNPEQGKVLTTDDNGNASWENAATGAEELNELTDAKTDANSIYIGDQTATNDDGDNYNTVIGVEALRENTSGNKNVAIGSSASLQNTTGNNNTAVGTEALKTNQTGIDNVAIGNGSLTQNIGSRNTAIGSGAGRDSYQTHGNIFIGYEAGKNEGQSNKLYIENSSSYLPLIGGDFSTNEVVINGTLAITGGAPSQGKVLTSDENGNASWQDASPGVQEINELTDAKTDENSVYVGAESGINDQGNNFNTSLGQQSLKMNTTGQGNTAIGLGSLQKNTTGKENTAIGLASMYSNQTGENNVAIGYTALGYYNSTGSGNVAVGDRSLLMNEGSENTALGKGAGQNSNENASGNVFIGYEAGKEEDGSNKLYIENSDSPTPLIGGDFETDKVDINGELNVQEELRAYDEATVYGNLNTLSDINAQKNLNVNDSITTSHIKITSGNPVAGKVLTTDDNGNASWEEAATTGAQELDDLNDAKTMFKSIFIGENAGQNESGNNSNTSIGYQTLMNNTTGGANNVLGREALMSNTHGDGNTAIGYKSQFSNTSGSNNTAIGNNTLYHNAGGNYNTAIGNNAGKGSEGNAVSGGVFIGNSAGYNETEDNKLYIENTSSSTPLIGGDFSTDEVVINGTLQITGGNPGDGKVLISDANGKASWGHTAGVSKIDDLSDAKNDNSSIFLGSSGGADQGNNSNTAVGISALNSNQVGSNNTAFGKSSLLSNNSGSNNAAFGAYSMELNTNGVNNTAMGSGALYNNGSGTNNTALGFEAGFGSYGSNSSGNVFLGYKAGYNETGSNKLYIDNSDTYYPLVYGDFSQNKLEVNGEFKVANGSYSNLLVNNSKIQANINIEANANVDVAGELSIDGDLTIEGQTTTNGPFMANDEIRANEQIVANGPILANHEVRAFDKIIAYDKIEAHGNVILSDNKNIKYENPRTGKLQLSGADFSAYVNAFDDYGYTIDYYNSVVRVAQFDVAEFYVEAPIHLPKGTTIKSYTVHYVATTGAYLTFAVKKRLPSSRWGYDELSLLEIIPNTDEQDSKYVDNISDPIIDEDYVYIFQVHGYPVLNEDGYSTFDLIGLTIEYEYDTLNY